MAAQDISKSTSAGGFPSVGTSQPGSPPLSGTVPVEVPPPPPPPPPITPPKTEPVGPSLKKPFPVGAAGDQEPTVVSPPGAFQPVDQKPPEKAGPDAPPPPPRKKIPKIAFAVGAVVLLAVVALLVNFLLKRRLPGVVTITWWGLWEEKSLVQPLIDEYEKQVPGVKVEYVKHSPQDYRERLTNALAKGNGPDIFRFHNTWVPMFDNELDNLPASVMSASEYAQNYYPVISSDLASGNGLVGIPIGYEALTLYISEDIFAEEDLSPPKTWVELRKTAKALAIKENDLLVRAGVALGRTENVDHWPEILGLMMVQNGVNLAKPTGKLAEDALTFFTIFSSVDEVWNETFPTSTIAFASGKVAMIFAPSWRAFEIQEQNPDLKFKTVPLPQIPKERPDEPDVAYATYWAEGVWARSKKKEAAWDFVKFISSQDSLEKLYQNAAAVRGFGEAYPRIDMRDLLLDHPFLGSVVQLAPDAQSWYLASRTFDGSTGINSQINKYFEDAVNLVNEEDDAERALEPAAQGVLQVLSQYGLARR